MAEAVCGPSNPLQNFQKHTSVDRTLQQDRTVLRQSPTQGFRTESPFAGSLDAEFQAFQTSQPLRAPQIPLQAPSNARQFPIQAPLAPSVAVPAQQNLPGWAADFQRLNISNPRPLTTPSFQSKDAAASGVMLSGWQKEFMAQEQGQSQRMHHAPNQGSEMNWQPQFQGQPYMSNMMNYAPPMLQQQQQQPGQINADHLDFDEAAFEQAFDAAKAAMNESTSKGKEKEIVEEAIQPQFNMSFACTDPGDVMGDYDFDKHASVLDNKAEDLTTSDPSQLASGIDDLDVHSPQQADDFPKIGSDTIPAKSGLSPEVESDELARTAGELLDSLKDEQSSKFQQSNFLGLMRQLRDKQVRIEGDKMVSVSTT